MREIPDLQSFCLRAVGSHSCSAEDSFTKLKNGEPSTASRLLRSFHKRPITSRTSFEQSKPSIESIPMKRRPCIGPGSSRRVNTNEVDLNHPFVGCLRDTDGQKNVTIMEYGCPSLDVLQSYIDSLVELGRMDDGRIGIHFFCEWKVNVQLAAGVRPEEFDVKDEKDEEAAAVGRPSKRRRSDAFIPSTAAISPDPKLGVTPLGSLSLHNCTIENETFGAMIQAGVGLHLAVLDLTGVRGLMDEFTHQLLPTMPNLKRLSLKNCRKITSKTIKLLPRYQSALECLDVGGCFNITTTDLLHIVPTLPVFRELHASGLQWNNETLKQLVGLRDTWQALSLGFTDRFTQTALRESLIQLGDSLQSLALPFCETVVDNALLGMLGRNLPYLKYLDLRGNPSINTVTGWYDGRASADHPVQSLTVLGRYTSISENSVEETRRLHPLHTANDLLKVHLDGGGMGAGITRVADEE